VGNKGQQGKRGKGGGGEFDGLAKPKERIPSGIDLGDKLCWRERKSPKIREKGTEGRALGETDRAKE